MYPWVEVPRNRDHLSGGHRSIRNRGEGTVKRAHKFTPTRSKSPEPPDSLLT